MDHKLFTQIAASDASEDELAELYEDLKFILDNPFAELIDEAVIKRGCVYVELLEQSVS